MTLKAESFLEGISLIGHSEPELAASVVELRSRREFRLRTIALLLIKCILPPLFQELLIILPLTYRKSLVLVLIRRLSCSICYVAK